VAYERVNPTIKAVGKFTEVPARNAGHLVSTDQPAWALDLITKFTWDGFIIPPKFSLQDFLKI